MADDFPDQESCVKYLRSIAQEDGRTLGSKVHPVGKHSPVGVLRQEDGDDTTMNGEAEHCYHSKVSYCVGQTDLKGEDVVFLEHRRPWPGRGEESFCGRKNHEEGATTFHDGCCSDCGLTLNEYSLFCVFDGHNGRHAAKHSADWVRETLEKHLPRGNAPPISHPDYDEWRGLIQRALAITLVELNGTFAAKGIHAGCTATVVLVTDWMVTCINLGDSHAFLDTGNQLIQLTSDHRVASNKLDRRRVELTGAVVAPVSMSGSGPADAYSPGLGPLRVWPGGLCISRAIGDFDVGPSIVPYGFITQTLVPSRGGRILIGSDGIWDAFRKKKKVGAMTRTWPLDVVPSKIISTIVRMHGTVKDDTSLIVVDILPSSSSFPEMVARSNKEGSSSSLRSLSMSNGGSPGLLCSCFGGGRANGANGSLNGSSRGGRLSMDDSVKGSTLPDDSVRSGVSLKSFSSMNSQGWVGCVIEKLDVAEVLDLMPSVSQSQEEFFSSKPDWMVDELKEALLAAAVFATETWLEASGRAPSKLVPGRPSRVSFADVVSVGHTEPVQLSRQSSEYFQDSVLHRSESGELSTRFGHYGADYTDERNVSTRLDWLPEKARVSEDDSTPTPFLLPISNGVLDMSVRAGRVYNSEASVRAGAQFKSKVEPLSLRLRGSNMEGSVHMKAHQIHGGSTTPDDSNDGRNILSNEPQGMLKTTTVRRGGK
jgi:serine/threonine protein phosphatase PrpC